MSSCRSRLELTQWTNPKMHVNMTLEGSCVCLVLLVALVLLLFRALVLLLLELSWVRPVHLVVLLLLGGSMLMDVVVVWPLLLPSARNLASLFQTAALAAWISTFLLVVTLLLFDYELILGLEFGGLSLGRLLRQEILSEMCELDHARLEFLAENERPHGILKQHGRMDVVQTVRRALELADLVLFALCVIEVAIAN